MNITIFGAGYVGLVVGACFSEMGNRVTCVDVNAKKVQELREGILPIYEPGLEQIVVKNSLNNMLFFTTDISKSITNTEIVFIAVSTPMG